MVPGLELLGKVKWLVIPLAAAFIALAFCSLLEVPNRWMITGIVFVAVLAIVLAIMAVQWARRRSRERGLENSIASGSPGRVDQKAEIEALRKRWRESLDTLKKTGAGGGGRQALAALPWYVIIGAPASGKSTLLRQSGIDFPVGDAALRGLQGTRNCDWWFSNVGVFLDTAGRYMSDESAQEWMKFLDLVRKQRTAAPVNGVIIAVPAPDLLSRDLGDLEEEGRRLRARLDELIDRLGINFPVWVVLTKVDLLGGFVEFCGRMDAQARQRLMGWTLPPAQGMRFDASQFEAQFEAVVDRLCEIRPQMLETASVRQRHVAFGFPDEVAALGAPLSRMMQRLFEPNVFQETPYFRGLYVTSATQEGTPLQQAVARIRERFGAAGVADAERDSLVKHSYFVEDLVKDRIVADRHMTWTTRTEMDRGKLRRIGINLVGCSLPVLAFLSILGMWKRADKDLSSVTEAVGKVETLPPVDASAELCQARQAVKTEKFSHLGLNAHWLLRSAIVDEEKFLYRRGILAPLFDSVGRAIAAPGGGDDLEPAVQAYGRFSAALGAFRRVVPGAPPPDSRGPSGTEGAPGGEGVPPGGGGADGNGKGGKGAGGDPPRALGGCEAPVEGLPAADRQAVEALYDLFTERKLAAPGEGRDARAHFAERLLGPVARYGLAPFEYRLRAGRKASTEAYDPGAGIQAVEAAFRARLKDFAGRVAAEMQRFEQDRDRGRQMVDRRIDAFRRQCLDATRGLAEEHETRDDAARIAEALRRSASGDSGGGPDPGGAGLDLGRARRSLDALEAAALLPKEEFDALVAAVDRGKLKDLASGKGQGDAQEAMASALETLEAALADLSRRSATLGNDVDDLAQPRDLDQARLTLEGRVRKEQEAWVARVRPALAALAGVDPKDYPTLPDTDRRRWGAAVESVNEALWRDALYGAYLESRDRGGYRNLCNALVNLLKRESESSTDVVYTVSRLRELNGRLSATPEWLDGRSPPAASRLREDAWKVAMDAFGAAALQASDFWTAECASTLTDLSRRDAWSARTWLLDNWTGERSRVGKFADRIKRALREEWDAPGAVGGRGLKDGREAVEKLRQDFRFFFEDMPPVRDALSRLLNCYDRAGEAASSGDGKDLMNLRREIQEGMKATGDSSWVRMVGIVKGARLPGDLARMPQDLERAVLAVQDDLASNLGTYFNERWNGVRPAVARAIADAGRGGSPVASEPLKAFLKDLREWFGRELGGSLGRLRPTSSFRTFLISIEGAEGYRETLDREGIQVTFVANAVPRGAQGYPYMQIEYAGRQGEPLRSPPFAAGGTAALPVTWRPGDALSLKILLLDTNRANPKLFRGWSGGDCVPRAIQEATRAGSVFRWDSRLPELANDTVAWEVQALGDGLERLLGYGKEGAPGEPPDRCVEAARGD